MNSVLAVSAVLAGVAIVAFVLLFRRLIVPLGLPVNTGQWLEDFSADKYRPMVRLLSEKDFEFLAAQPGFEPGLARKLRSTRRRLFRSYLHSLVRDFNRLHLIARMLVLYSPHDRPDLSALLLRQKLRFIQGVLLVQVRLALHAAGVGTVDVSGLVEALSALRAEVREVAAGGERIEAV